MNNYGIAFGDDLDFYVAIHWKVENMIENTVVEKSFDFAIRIVKLHQYLKHTKSEHVMSKQLLRCGTSIGANIAEAQYGQSKADFHTKMQIALKEASETSYWLRLLNRTDYLSEKEFKSLMHDTNELLRLLTAICKSSE